MSKAKHLKDPNGQHIRLYKTMFDSPAWKVLSNSAKALWVDLRVQTVGFTNGTASTALGVLGHTGWVSRHTVMNARRELEVLGFIDLTHRGGICHGGKSPNLYRFTDLDMYDQKKYFIKAQTADQLYRNFKTKTEAEEALKQSKSLKEKVKVHKVPVQGKDSTLRTEKISVEMVH